jgi:hypothetical protein
LVGWLDKAASVLAEIATGRGIEAEQGSALSSREGDGAEADPDVAFAVSVASRVAGKRGSHAPVFFQATEKPRNRKR